MLAEVFEILGENSPLVDIFILYPKNCCYFKYLAGTQSKLREIVRYREILGYLMLQEC